MTPGRHARPAALLLPPGVQRRVDVVLARLLLHGLLGHPALMLAQRRRPMVLADFKAERPARDAGAQGVPRRHLLGRRPGHRRQGRGHGQGHLSRLADDMAGHRARRHRRHERRAGRRPHARRPRTSSSGSPRRASSPKATRVTLPLVRTTTCRRAEAVHVKRRRPRASRAADADRRWHAARRHIASRGEDRRLDATRRHGRARRRVTGAATSAQDDDAAQVSCPVLPYGLKREVGVSGTVGGTAEQHGELDIPDGLEPGRPHDRRDARAVARRAAARRARLPDRLSLRVHRADAVELPAEPARPACARGN